MEVKDYFIQIKIDDLKKAIPLNEPSFDTIVSSGYSFSYEEQEYLIFGEKLYKRNYLTDWVDENAIVTVDGEYLKIFFGNAIYSDYFDFGE